MKKFTFLLFIFFCMAACKESTTKHQPPQNSTGEVAEIDYAEGFSITHYDDYSILTVSSPWPKAEKKFTYLLAKKDAKVPADVNFDEKVTIPVKKMVVTSTTHIPSLESLEEERSLIGFPHLDYISSKKTRKLIQEGKIKDVGENESINTEILLDLQPDVVIGFAVENGNKTLQTISKSGIPVIYNGDWTEADPLGKAEWIKFFGAFYGKDKMAAEIFKEIETEYQNAKKLAEKSREKPTVLAGAMYKDIWYLPYGNSWQAQFIKDANAHYLYEDTSGNGSISLAFESVLDKAQNADIWISPGEFTSYQTMKNTTRHYAEFKAFQQKNIYNYAGVKGETGGILYYELGPQRPDLILKDLIKIFHPELLKDYSPTFFKALE